jgi:NADH-quinone oxidoreductase subunit M
MNKISFDILSVLIFLPLIAGLVLMFIKKHNSVFYYSYGCIVGIFNFMLSIYAMTNYKWRDGGFQYQKIYKIFTDIDIKYFVGVDGMAVTMIFLTALLTPICFIISYKSITHRAKEFVIAFLAIESLVIGAFASLDLLFFYIFFEATLIPMFLVIGIWGGENRLYASYKFFIYTLAGSVFFLIGIILLFLYTKTTDIIVLTSICKNFFPLNFQVIFFVLFFASFAIKVPMFPFHTWLPDAHVQAPTAGSVILAGILIKLGAFGFIRYSLPLFPLASQYFADTIFVLSLIAIIYGSLVALMQEDMKKMIAYSSVAHMGFVTMGIFSLTHQGIEGAIMQMISHGLISSALFICVGIIYDRLHTKKIKDLGGLATKMPNFAMFAMILTMGSVGLPGTSGFVGEFLTIIGTFKVNKLVAMLAGIGVVLGACYMLWLYKRVWFSEIHNEKISKISDLNFCEFTVLLGLSIMIIALGFIPNLIMNFFNEQSAQLSVFVNTMVPAQY